MEVCGGGGAVEREGRCLFNNGRRRQRSGRVSLAPCSRTKYLRGASGIAVCRPGVPALRQRLDACLPKVRALRGAITGNQQAVKEGHFTFWGLALLIASNDLC